MKGGTMGRPKGSKNKPKEEIAKKEVTKEEIKKEATKKTISKKHLLNLRMPQKVNLHVVNVGKFLILKTQFYIKTKNIVSHVGKNTR